MSRSMELKPGDVIITGRPAGVGAIVAADKVAGGIDGLGEIDIAVGQPIVRRPGGAARDWLGQSANSFRSLRGRPIGER